MKLLDLPPEILFHIWKDVVVSPGQTWISHRCTPRFSPRRCRRLADKRKAPKDITSSLALALVCRKTHVEATKCCYSLNIFSFSDMCHFLKARSRNSIYYAGIECLKDFIIGIGSVNVGNLANLWIAYKTTVGPHVRLTELPLRLKVLGVAFEPVAPDALLEYISAKEGTGLKLRYITYKEDPLESLWLYENFKPFIHRANRRLAVREPGVKQEEEDEEDEDEDDEDEDEDVKEETKEEATDSQ